LARQHRKKSLSREVGARLSKGFRNCFCKPTQKAAQLGEHQARRPPDPDLSGGLQSCHLSAPMGHA